MAALVVRWTGDWAAGTAAGVVYAFAPTQIASGAWLHVLATFCFPVLLLALEMVLVGPPRAGAWLLAATLAWQMTLGVYGTIFAAVLCVVFGGAYLIALGRPRPWRRVWVAALAAAATLPVLAAMAYPYVVASPLAGGTYDLGGKLARQGMSLFPLNPLDGLLAIGRRLGRVTGVLREAPGHAGLPLAVDGGRPALVLATLGVWYALRGTTRVERSRGAALAAVILAGFLLALGPGFIATPLGAIPLPLVWIDDLPLVGGLRTPERYVLVSLVGLAAAAGLGLAALLRGRPPWLRVGAAALVVGLVRLDSGPIEARPVPPFGEAPPAYRTLRDRGDGTPVLEWPILTPAHVAARHTLEASWHWQPTTLCFTSVYPPAWWEFVETMRDASTPASFAAALDGAGIRWILVHRREATLEPALVAAAGARLVAEDGDDLLFARPAGRDERPRLAALEALRRTSARALVERALEADLDLETPRTTAAGEPTTLRIHVVNRGDVAWPASGAAGGAIRVRAGWRRLDGRPLLTLTDPGHLTLLASLPRHWRDTLEERYRVADVEVGIEGPVGPGEARDVTVETRAPLAPARYRLVAAVGRTGGVPRASVQRTAEVQVLPARRAPAP
jgi:hypothetical protein